mmetsp:Transcript_17134/g.32520  ORF Transcript_17134/g.32520 Transcript_17134/m.32520 type:complete len:312 (-) Transcript_17134:210-1145(-)
MLLEWRFKSTRKPILFSLRYETEKEKEERLKAMLLRSSSLSGISLGSPLSPPSPDPLSSSSHAGHPFSPPQGPSSQGPLSQDPFSPPPQSPLSPNTDRNFEEEGAGERAKAGEGKTSSTRRSDSKGGGGSDEAVTAKDPRTDISVSDPSIVDKPRDSEALDQRSARAASEPPTQNAKDSTDGQNIHEKKKSNKDAATAATAELKATKKLDTLVEATWTPSHKGWCYGSAMVYSDSIVKICFQPVVRYVVGRGTGEPIQYGVAIKILKIPPGDGKLGSLLVHSISEKRRRNRAKTVEGGWVEVSSPPPPNTT